MKLKYITEEQLVNLLDQYMEDVGDTTVLKQIRIKLPFSKNSIEIKMGLN